MLTKIKGAPVTNLPWDSFAVDEVLMYYDGPRLLLQRSAAGQWYLSWWNGADADTERWVCLPVTLPRLQAVLSGQMPSRQAMQDPEGGYLLVVDCAVTDDAVVRVVKTTADAIPPDSLPQPGSCLKIPLPAAVRAELAAAAVAPGKIAFDETAPSILEIFDEIHRNAPEGAFDELPTDLSANLKHYLYGFPKEA